MKSTALLLLLLIGFTATAQTTRIADNTPNRPTGANIFATIQAAVNAAAPGDIVYITPSLTSYGDVTISKRIKLVGVGFNTPELGSRSSTLGTITLLSSADGVNSTSNSEFRGFIFSDFIFAAGGVGTLPYNDILIEKISGRYITYSGSPNALNNLTIKTCYAQAIFLFTNTDTRIFQNVLQIPTFNGTDALQITNATNALITNNLISLAQANICAITITNSTNTRIEHNLFSGSSFAFRNLTNTPVTNNIFYGVNPGSTGATNFSINVFSNNLVTPAATMPPAAVGGGANSGLGNLANLSPLFVNGPASATTWAEAYDYSFPNTSPCYNAATTGDNIGPSGGLYPLATNVVFAPSAIPLITLFNNSGVVPQNQPLKSNIKAKSN